jgi:hypothetical protein
MYVVVKPDQTLIKEGFASMTSAQEAIEAIEQDVIARNQYAIHPINDTDDARQFGAKVNGKIVLERFNGEYVGQAPVEVIERKF